MMPTHPGTASRTSSPRAVAATGDALRASWEAWSTGVVLRVSDPSALALARAQVERELDAIDLACSRFRNDSELTRVNHSDGRPVAASELLIDAIELALEGARLTDGAVDPTIGRALELAGYDRDWGLLSERAGSASEDTQPSATSPRSPASTSEPTYSRPTARADCGTITVRRRPGWQAVVVDRVRSCVRVPRGVHLDLGATAKGWAADRAALAAAWAGDCGALVGIGGDIATAGAPPLGGWRVHVTDDHRSPPTAPGQTVTIRSGGLATSSVAVRRWRRGDRMMHHIIDPRTGEPADTAWRTVSVAAASCAEANIAATAALVKGSDAPAWLEQHGLPARLVGRDGRVRYVGEWPRQGDAR
jgi:thiamine biosynthesis lipoprotein